METAKKYNILIVDDDKFLLNMYSMKFTKEGMAVTAIGDPQEALEKLRGGLTPDIIVMDIVMPGMDGIELLTKIRAEKLSPSSVVIVLSNQGQQSDIDRAKAIGINGYIVKATTIPSEVLREVERIAEESKK
ncbi:MAG: two-component system, OmpR family, response regulator [Patescibacteria group bacterium]|jgi:CheY-like chemotaxis protein|nr:two-component system, OmpR family, response regulator [Patescibacteria group bacterium]